MKKTYEVTLDDDIKMSVKKRKTISRNEVFLTGVLSGIGMLWGVVLLVSFVFGI